ncbi:phosphate acyltransferase PlsX [Dehalobacterium formicoaceticum]|uniref:Phosphate acyltransferase n=1 Tax=Dehalobacterium formicoaceticum TaxID=51515 RepID=A0ABT1XZZ1_9FIRM|nr:phosphate acyltransferase PlsX [Dehalobacterium formicoaceticum]MCR6544192.1 phosphate acyltransferase PlsX [Dehalobacterium formicoaceticum]
MRIAVDVMGGDYAPGEIITGAIQAGKQFPDTELILVGREDLIKKDFSQLPSNIRMHHASEVMGMDESVESLRKKKDSSIWVATKLVKDKEADAVVSAGSTAAQMASALLLLKRIEGIDRPAISAIYPTLQGGKVILDVGANANAEAKQLVQFALMGKTYAEVILKMQNPRIALLSNGSEEGKGNETVVAAHQLLKNTQLNFIGNIEGRDIPAGTYDVAVCDGFVGNVLLKVSEGLGSALFALMKKEFEKDLRGKLGAALLLPGLKNIKKMMDYAETGGAPLLGVKGVSIICHGSSKARAIENAIRVARDCVGGRFIEQMEVSIGQEGGS